MDSVYYLIIVAEMNIGYFDRTWWRQILLSLLLILFCTSGVAWDKNPLTQSLNIYNGLSDDTVNDIMCDSKGFVWIATRKGLDRYDGCHIKHISVNDPKSKWY